MDNELFNVQGKISTVGILNLNDFTLRVEVDLKKCETYLFLCQHDNENEFNVTIEQIKDLHELLTSYLSNI